MERIPRAILNTLEDLYKRYSVSPRDYPGVHIHWQGCGDSGGIEEMHFLTPEGIKFCKENDAAPPSYLIGERDPSKYYYTQKRTGIDFNGNNTEREYTVDIEEGNDYTLGQFIYERFSVCEVNDGGYAHAFIEMPHGKMWGESWDYVSEERINTSMAYED